MFTRISLMIIVLAQISGCIATPRYEISEKIDFNALAPDHKVMSYNDLLCCYDCTA